MADYSKTIKIRAEHVTITQSLRPSTLLRFLQEVSIEHTEELGMPRQFTLDKGLLWVVAKQHIEILRMPRYDETIKINTWPSKTMHVLFPRTYEIFDEQGNLIVRGAAIWALIDINTRKMVNPNEHGIHIPDLSLQREFKIPLSNKIPLELENDTTMEARYSLCDLNGHVNNTCYLDIAEDKIPLDFLKSHELKLIDIKYTHEVPVGTKLPMKFGFFDHSYYFVNEAFALQLGY